MQSASVTGARCCKYIAKWGSESQTVAASKPWHLCQLTLEPIGAISKLESRLLTVTRQLTEKDYWQMTCCSGAATSLKLGYRHDDTMQGLCVCSLPRNHDSPSWHWLPTTAAAFVFVLTCLKYIDFVKSLNTWDMSECLLSSKSPVFVSQGH